MNASMILLLVPTLCYAAVAALEMRRGDYANVMVYGGYALANIGLIIGLR